MKSSKKVKMIAAGLAAVSVFSTVPVLAANKIEAEYEDSLVMYDTINRATEVEQLLGIIQYQGDFYAPLEEILASLNMDVEKYGNFFTITDKNENDMQKFLISIGDYVSFLDFMNEIKQLACDFEFAFTHLTYYNLEEAEAWIDATGAQIQYMEEAIANLRNGILERIETDGVKQVYTGTTLYCLDKVIQANKSALKNLQLIFNEVAEKGDFYTEEYYIAYKADLNTSRKYATSVDGISALNYNVSIGLLYNKYSFAEVEDEVQYRISQANEADKEFYEKYVLAPKQEFMKTEEYKYFKP